jgi:hypothetical protein
VSSADRTAAECYLVRTSRVSGMKKKKNKIAKAAL